MTVLILKSGGAEIARVMAGAWLSLPDGRSLAPAVAGWSDDQGYSLEVAPLTQEEARALMSLSFAQLLIGLVAEGWILEAEGDAWLTGTLPLAVTELIDGMPEEQRFAARARAIRPSVVLRTDPLVVALAVAQGKTPEQIDAFFATYAQV